MDTNDHDRFELQVASYKLQVKTICPTMRHSPMFRRSDFSPTSSNRLKSVLLNPLYSGLINRFRTSRNDGFFTGGAQRSIKGGRKGRPYIYRSPFTVNCFHNKLHKSNKMNILIKCTFPALFCLCFLLYGCGGGSSGPNDSGSDSTTVVEMLYNDNIPPGYFYMGGAECDTIDITPDSSEIVYYYLDSTHVVTLTHTLSVSKYEISNAHYIEALQTAYNNGWVYLDSMESAVRLSDKQDYKLLDLNSNYCEIYFVNSNFRWKAGFQNHPVKEVSWFGAAAYCNWRNMIDSYEPMYDPDTWESGLGCQPYNGNGWRLLTEAEWEYCAAYDTADIFRKYPWGFSAPNFDYVNFNNLYGWSWPVWPLNNEYEHVNNRSFFGLYNMGGNILEWVNDWWDELPQIPETDPVGPLSPPGGQSVPQRVLRGGAWDQIQNDLRCAARYHSDPGHSSQYIGFRICRVTG